MFVHNRLHLRHFGRTDDFLMKRPARFVDAHVHLWKLDAEIAYPWLTPPFSDAGVTGNVGAIAVNYGLDEYLEDAAAWNVEGIVHIDAGAAPKDALSETQWLQSIADARGMPNAIVGFAGLHEPNVEAVLEAQASYKNVRGIRHIVNWHRDAGKTYSERDLTTDPQWRAGYALLAKYGLSFDCQIYPGQMPVIAALAAEHPDIPVMLNHAGMMIDAGDDALAEWKNGMTALAALPHVSVKLSGFGIVDHGWTPESIRPLILTAIDLFGVDRVMAASDFPTDKLFGSFDETVGALASAVSDFSETERDAIFAANALRIYRIA